jgi:Bacterial PH domain
MRERMVRLRKLEGSRVSPFTPQAVMPYLLPYEKAEITFRRHPAVLANHAGLLACALAAASLLTALTGSGIYTLIGVWGACGIILASLIIRVAEWFGAFIVVTDARLIFITGLIRRNTATVLLREITEAGFESSRPGRILGYGKIFLTLSADSRKAMEMNYLPYPEQLYLEIAEAIFRKKWES